MKLFTIAATFIFYFNFQAFTQEIVIKGKITNPVTNTVALVFPSLSDKYEYVNVKLDSINNTFEYRRQLNDIAYIDFYHKSFTEGTCENCYFNNIIIEPGDEVYISFDTKNFWNTLKFEGKSAEKFKYHAEDDFETNKKKDLERIIRQHANKPIEEYFATIDQALETKLAILQKYKQKLSPMYYAIKEADIMGIINKNRLSVLYDTTIQDYKPLQLFPYAVQQSFFKNLPSQNDTTVKAQHFFAYITNLSYAYISEFNALTKNSDSQKKLSVVRQNQVYFHPAFAEQLSGQIIVKNLAKRGIMPAYQQDIAEFKTLYPDSPILQEIAQLLHVKKDFTVGKPAMPFKVLELTGKEISLQDFQGKVVYLDFWSSSCVPCILDIEQVKKVKEHFKDRNDIVFLYISLDTNEEKWKNAINKYAIKGTHGIAFDTNPVIEDYVADGIPSYFIIGKDGNFHTIQPIRPSFNEGKGLINTLEKALAVNTNE